MVQLPRYTGYADRQEVGRVAELLYVRDDLVHDDLVHVHELPRQPGVREQGLGRQALLRVAPQQARDEALGHGRDAVPEGARHRVPLLPHAPEHLQRAAVERRLPAQQDVGHDPQAPEVAGAGVARVLGRWVKHLRGGEGAAADAGLHPRLREVLGQPPVDDLHAVVRGLAAAEADVLRLHVAVRDAAAVRVAEGAGRLLDDVCRRALLHGALVHDEVAQVAALEVLNDEEHEPALHVGLEELADAGVV
mmetsp:Transcript_86739/g.280838  ORF Transcript_86739/g.280838 Transcript_86739/m.280838 type:complete len:249 (+) Transcript_86739:827-1573(+)